MADGGGKRERRSYPGQNLLLSSAPELSLSAPATLLPVVTGADPAAAAAALDDGVEAGEEDSFVGQAPPPTFSFFSQAAHAAHADPFASIVHPGPPNPGSSRAPQSGAPQSGSPYSGSPYTRSPVPFTGSEGAAGNGGDGKQPLPTSRGPSPTAGAGLNPYRHTALSSRANPYVPPPQMVGGGGGPPPLPMNPPQQPQAGATPLTSRQTPPPFGQAPPTVGYVPPPASYTPPMTGYTAPPAGYTPSTSGYNPPASGYSPPTGGYAPPTTSFAPPMTGYAPPTTGYTPPTTDYAPTGYAHPTTGYAPPTTRYIPPTTGGYAPLPGSQSLPTFGQTPPPPSQILPPGGQPALSPGAQPPPPGLVYEAVQHHWFFCRSVEGKEVWTPFSLYDSLALEEAFNSVHPDPESVVVSTFGGRYDVSLYERERRAVYWDEAPGEVRRCCWFSKGDAEARFTPYGEEFSEQIEAEYKKTIENNSWHRRLEFPSGETIVMHNPKVIVQFSPLSPPDEWGTTPDGAARPRVVKRGIDDLAEQIPDGEVGEVDHLVFMVHGIGPVCDLRFRTIVECVDDFRSVSLALLQSHFRRGMDEQRVRRVEFLPVHWHRALHGDATGLDRRLKKITLPSIGRLRHFTNETLLDILFYSSPTYCQTMVSTVGGELNRLHRLFLQRNPTFRGRISLAGHSLGSLILFDLLCNQKEADIANGEAAKAEGPGRDETGEGGGGAGGGGEGGGDDDSEEEEGGAPPGLEGALSSLGLDDFRAVLDRERVDMESLLLCSENDLKEMGIPLGPRKKLCGFVKERVSAQKRRQSERERRRAARSASPAPVGGGASAEGARGQLCRGLSGAVSSLHVDYQCFASGTGQVSVRYPRLEFSPRSFFALGSPIGMFLTVRGLDSLDQAFRLPTCPGFYNIYHPLDPVAYRLEPMILPHVDLKPVLIPHHKGRKRLHLELKDTIEWMGTDMKEELKESLTRMGSELKQGVLSSLRSAWHVLHEFARAHNSPSPELQAELREVAEQIRQQQQQQDEETQPAKSPDEGEPPPSPTLTSLRVGALNGGRRVDYVLQEKPIESFNEYLFALQSHLCYWESEDTSLLILKEIYRDLGVRPETLQ
ncbi:LOW QUALITY PROTEIN: triacylglycerol hydrolase DDHD2-like [Lampetra planeri]